MYEEFTIKKENANTRQFTQLDKIGRSTLVNWLQEAIKKGVKKILVMYYDYHYTPYYLKNDGNEEKEIYEINRSGDSYEGTIDVADLKSLIK